MVVEEGETCSSKLESWRLPPLSPRPYLQYDQKILIQSQSRGLALEYRPRSQSHPFPRRQTRTFPHRPSPPRPPQSPSLPSPPARLSMAKITEIPPEILIKFAELGANFAEHLDDEAKRRQFLRTFSLVHPSWRHPGQSTLWRDVKFKCSTYSPQQGIRKFRKFATSPATKRGLVTRVLHVGGRLVQNVGILLDACTGITKLSLQGPFRMDGDDPPMEFDATSLEKDSLSGEWFRPRREGDCFRMPVNTHR